MLHRTRDLLMRQRTQLINALRAHLAELGIVAAQGREGIKELLRIIASEEDVRLSVDAHASWRAGAGRRHQPIYIHTTAFDTAYPAGHLSLGCL